MLDALNRIQDDIPPVAATPANQMPVPFTGSPKRQDSQQQHETSNLTNEGSSSVVTADIVLAQLMAENPELDLTGQVKKTLAYPFASGYFAEVWKGLYRGEIVAIKTLRAGLAPDEKIKKVCFLN